jgi:ankyrin repeat protein
MKIKFLLAVLLLATALHLLAATNDLTTRLQQGLFDEEASRDLNAAVADYQALAAQFDQDRQIAATAIYRLGECYRKLGQTNDAVTQYQRLIREFADQKDLVTLSRQNLTGLGVDSQTNFAQRLQTVISGASSEAKATSNSTAVEEVQSLANHLTGLEQLKNDPEKRAYTVLALFPDNDLNNMLVRLPLLKEQEAQAEANTNTTFTVTALPFDATSMSEEQFFHQVGKGFTTSREGGPTLAHQQIVQQLSFIGLRVDFIISLQQARLKAMQVGVWMTTLNSGTPNTTPATVNSIPDLEGAEIVRIQQMIQDSPDLINAPGGENRLAPLSRAALNGWLKVAAYLLDHGADVNGGANSGATALYEAAGAGNRAMVELLLRRGAEVNATQSPQALAAMPTALAVAVSRGFPAVVEVLLAAKADVNVPNSKGETALHEAAANGQHRITQMLLAAGANPNAKSHNGSTPLMLAAEHSPGDILQLLTAGADPNLINDRGRTALSYAAEFGSAPDLQFLLSAKADPNGGTLDAPLLFAIGKSDLAAAECLLKAGANPNAIGSVDGDLQRPGGSGEIFGNFYHVSTPLFFAVWTDQLPLVQLLLNYHADPNDERTDGRSLLFSALDKPDILAALLAAGANADARDTTSGAYIINGVARKPNFTPLIRAVSDDKISAGVVAILLNHGANPNLPDDTFSRTPLLWSIGWNTSWVPNRTVVELLLAHHADPNLRDLNGRTILAYLKSPRPNTSPADQTNLAGLCDLLRQHGALDHLPDWNHITASRPSANFSRLTFTRDTNNWNQFTLLELIAVQWHFLAATPAATSEDDDESVFFAPQRQSLPFPDLNHLRIQRPTADQKTNQEIAVNLGAGLQSGDCSHTVPLVWGDVVEIPEIDHGLKETWPGYSDQELRSLTNCLTRHIAILIKGQTNILTLAPKIRFSGEMMPMGSGGYRILHNTVITSQTPFWLGPVLLKSQLVLTSSDLSRVQVTRLDPATGKTRTCTVDCTGISQNQFNDPDLWLRDGDLIAIPEKP